MLNNVMIKGIRFTLLLVCLALSASVLSAPALRYQTRNDSGGIRYVSIPADMSRTEVIRSSDSVRERLSAFLKEGMQSEQPVGRDLLVILVDHSGLPILPDSQAAKGTKRNVAGGLSFTFDSPASPWSSEQLSTLGSAVNGFYPAIKQIYGNPAFDITVNVRRDPALLYSGLYNPSLNEIVLRVADPSPQDLQPAVPLDVLCHEMIHAFRDDDVITLGTYEDGMARAVEVEVFSMLNMDHWDGHHRYDYDVYYEALNEPVIGAPAGNIDSGYPGVVLLRYQLAGYAWAKIFLENPDFFVNFNEKLYQSVQSNSATKSSEATLLGIAASIQLDVEGEPFLTWYEKQHVFDTTPDAGYILYQRLNKLYFMADLFQRDESGAETALPSVRVQWKMYDYEGKLLSRGTGVTSEAGFFDVASVPTGYAGRIAIEASTSFGRDKVRNTVFRFLGSQQGVFGVVTDSDIGTVTITPLDAAVDPVTVNLVNGAFSAPTMASVRGRMRAEFKGPAGVGHTRLFTKDASDYYLLITP